MGRDVSTNVYIMLYPTDLFVQANGLIPESAVIALTAVPTSGSSNLMH